MRRCVGCRKARPQAELLRLAVREGAVVADPDRRVPGRGCSICRDVNCATRAVKARQIGRALKGRAPDPPIDRVLEWVGNRPVA